MVKALGDKIVVQLMKKNVTKGGIVVPENAMTEPQAYGKVLSVGENINTVKEGDTLTFHYAAGMDMVFDMLIYKVLKYEEVYGIIQDEDLIGQLECLDLSRRADQPEQKGSIIQ